MIQLLKSALNKGFTLTELVIVVAIIGVISAMMIPKVWVNSQHIQRQSTLRTTITVLENHFASEHMRDEQGSGEAARWAAMKTAFQYQTACGSGEADIAVCAGGSATADGYGFIFNSGVSVHGLLDNLTGTDSFYVDLNGAGEPNLDCADRHTLVINNGTGEITYPNTCTRDLFERTS
jgi:prepilin-type N-terminal cleavage/methylation domain-containing protein